MPLVLCHQAEIIIVKRLIQDATARRELELKYCLINLYFRSTQVADSIKDELGCLLVIPTITRWNSTFDAVNKLMQILRDREMRSGLNRICTSVRLPTFTNGM